MSANFCKLVKSFKIFTFSILLFFLIIQTTGSVHAQTKFTGNYNLSIYGVSRWKTDYISIKNLGLNTVGGVIGLDWNILQEARLPADFEKMHEIPFKGSVEENRSCIEFKVRVADVKEYSFILFFMECFSKPAFVGYVEITSLRFSGNTPPPAIKTGVFAIMK